MFKSATMTLLSMRVPHWVLGLMITVILTGCGSGYGRLQHHNEVTRMFSTGDLPQDYVYYYNGRDHIPYAIIGLSPGYRHVSKFWEKVDPNSERFRYMVEHMWQPYQYYESVGAYILDMNRNRIGVWFAKYYYTVVELGPDKAVTVHSPYKPNLRIGR